MEPAVAADFRADTAVEALGEGRWGATIRPSWSGPPGPNGGYVAALLLRAIRAEIDDPVREPRSLTVHYLRPPREDAVEISVTVERSGRSASTCTARMWQGGKVTCLAICVLAPDFESAADLSSPPPAVATADSLQPVEGAVLSPPIFDQLELRITFGGPPFASAEEADVGGWIRTKAPAPLEPELIAMYTDCWWPAPFAIVAAPFLAPTLELTIHFRGRPPAGEHEHVLGRFTTKTSDRGYFEEDGWIWAADGILLAQSRQLALIRPWTQPG